MADLRTRYLEDYAGGFLNVARQEISSTGEVLAQDGFDDQITLFVEDGRGVKSGLRLGPALAECVDPVTETGLLNVRTADRTYAKIRDLKIFSTAVASAQAALSQTASDSFANLEEAFESLENDVQVYRTRTTETVDNINQSLSNLSGRLSGAESSLSLTQSSLADVNTRLAAVESTITSSNVVKQERTAAATSPILASQAVSDLDVEISPLYALLSVGTDVAAWVSIYVSPEARADDVRTDPEQVTDGVVADIITSTGNLQRIIAPAALGYSPTTTVSVKVRNLTAFSARVGVQLRYISL